MLRKWKRANMDDKGETTLMQKDKEKGNAASNYSPITCLPLVWILCKKFMDFWIQICYYLKNKKDVRENLGEKMIYCLLIR